MRCHQFYKAGYFSTLTLSSACLSGCIGDKVTFSETANITQRENAACFEVQGASDYTLKSMSIFRRGHEDDRQSLMPNNTNLKDERFICLSESVIDEFGDGEYVVRFSLKPIKKRQNTRVFSNAIQIDGRQVKNIPLQENEITHYLGNNF
ncbi:putative T6SS immunity periplasmic lipoprotein [Pantoea trifolii]|uniref:putative T6SS immunity periplasmic lipoprotein n=1 Tax=Pantoea trifolii TaxID=2968030 RepID=UPI003ED8DC83